MELGVLIQFTDWVRGQCRYPQKMLGRDIKHLSPSDNTSRRILVFAAHPDDEVIGIGGLLAGHVRRGDHVFLVFTTNGRGKGWFTRVKNQAQYVDQRYREAFNAADVLGIPRHRMCFLGFPDGTLYRYMPYLLLDVNYVFREVRPHRVYVHALEGGHVDHDATNVVVRAASREIDFTHVWEWAEYSRTVDVGDPSINFPTGPNTEPVLKIPTRWDIKKPLLNAYSSQPPAQRASHHFEVVRKANFGTLKQEIDEIYGGSGPNAKIASQLSRIIDPLNGVSLFSFVGAANRIMP